MGVTDTPSIDVEQLRASLQGTAVGPDELGFDEARGAFNLLVDQRPAVVALPADARDVAAVVDFARERGVRVAAQRTGHNAGPLGPLGDTILLKTARLDGAAVDVDARTARVGAGARWLDVVPEASDAGLAALHGSAPRVGVVGYTLGGGMGWYARKLGLAATSVTSAEVVTADGEVVRADAASEPELFWALRGGGGDFGIVTELEFALYPLPEVYAGALFFPLVRAAEVLHAWHEWLGRGVPDEVTSVGRVLQFPPLPVIPEPMRGKSFAVLEAVFMGSEDDGASLLAPLRDLGAVQDTFATVPPAGIAELHMDPPDPVPGDTCHRLVGELPASAIDALVEVAGPGSGSPLVSVELRHTGGALATVPESAGALGTLPGEYSLFAVGAVFDERSGAAVRSQLELVEGSLAAYDAGRYLSFTEHPVDVASMFPAPVVDRLRAVKERYDPGGVIRSNHPVAR